MIYRFRNCSIDVERRELVRAGELQDVQPKVLDLILYLIRERNRVVPRNELLDALWGDAAVIEGALSTAVHAARAALGESAARADCIKTIARHGYHFVADVETSGASEARTPLGFSDAYDSWTSDAFVGRGPCLARLNAALAAAAAGRGRVVVLTGESGIGKTRVLDEFAGRISDTDTRVLTARCYGGEGSPPYWPWVQILRTAIMESAPADALADMGTGASDIAALVPALHELRPDLPEPPGLQSGPSRFRLFESIASYFAHACKRQPILILIDDLHTADHASQRLLSFLAREVHYQRVLVAVTVRSGETSFDSMTEETLAELARQSPGERWNLEGLSGTETSQLIECLTGEPPSDHLSHAIIERSEGNPFFIREIVNLLQAQRPQGEALEETPTSTAVPPGVRDVILQRLHRRSGPCQKTLGRAAVLGRSFRGDLLARLVELDDDAFADALREGGDAGFLREVPESPGHYSFTHGLMQEALYAESSVVDRAKWHRRAGEVLEALEEEKTAGSSAMLAHHFLLSATADESEKAVDYSVRAAEDAIEVHAPDEAVRYYGRALEALELAIVPDNAQRCELLISLGAAQLKARRFDATGRTSLLDAARLAREIGEPRQLARAALELAAASHQGGPGDGAVIEMLEAALEALGESDDATRARVMSALALQSLSPATTSEAAALAHDAVTLAGKAGDPVTLGETLNLQCTLLSGPEHVHACLGIADSLLELARDTGNAELAFFGHRWRFVSTFRLGEIDAADDELLAYHRLASTSRSSSALWHTSTIRAMRAFIEGRLVDADHLMVQTLAKSRHEVKPLTVYSFGAQLFWLRRAQGRLGELTGLASQNMAASSRVPVMAAFRATRALVAAEGGDREQAQEELRAFTANGLADVPSDFTRLYCLAVLSEVCAALGDEKAAPILYEALLPHADLNVILLLGTVCLGSTSRYLGQLATVNGEWTRAEAHYADALEMNDRIRARLFSAETQLDWAQMIRAKGGAGAAAKSKERVASCLATVRELGLRDLRTRANALA